MRCDVEYTNRIWEQMSFWQKTKCIVFVITVLVPMIILAFVLDLKSRYTKE